MSRRVVELPEAAWRTIVDAAREAGFCIGTMMNPATCRVSHDPADVDAYEGCRHRACDAVRAVLRAERDRR